MKEVALSEVKDDLSKYLRLAETEEIVITRHGKPAGLLVGFASEDDWFEYRLEHDSRFLRRIERARQSLPRAKVSPWKTSLSKDMGARLWGCCKPERIVARERAAPSVFESTSHSPAA